MKTRREEIPTYVTKDGSTIRELMHPNHHGGQNQSLAEATIPPGGKTRLHRHRQTEEIYHIVAGRGEMTLGDTRFPVQPGDTVLIPPGTPHAISNHGRTTLKILCCCAPPYHHDDTELLDQTFHKSTGNRS